MKWYGAIENRLDENKMFCDKIEVGTKMTEYFYSDTKPYEVTKVINPKHIFVKRMKAIKADDIEFSNNWNIVSDENAEEQEMAYRYNHWCWVIRTELKTFYRKTNVSFGIAQYYFDYSF